MLLNKHLKENNEISHKLNASSKSVSGNYFTGKTDFEIWRLFKKGHEGAFKYIYEKNVDLLFRYGLHFISDQEFLHDSIHDLFVELRISKKLSDTDSIKFYLLKAFKNKIKRSLDQSSRVKSVSEDHWFLTNPSEPSIETRLIQNQSEIDKMARLRRAVNMLPLRQREALYYFYQENMSYRQVSEIMGFDYVRSARNIVYKALDFLRSHLQ